MTYKKVKLDLKKSPKKWLITGVAGFIGSNLLEELLQLNQKVLGVDNFATGFQANLVEVKKNVEKRHWKNFKFIEGDIKDPKICNKITKNIDYILHQAALGSVPRSIKDPIATNESNISGFLNILNAAKNSNVRSFTYAASSSTYGDHPALPKVEENIGSPLSPYAVSKYVNELYAEVFFKVYGYKSIGLRYFNVFGKRQNPDGAYAAVIPKWINSMIKNDNIIINGDGKTSRDFCYIDNVVQANILASVMPKDKSHVFNVAFGQRTTLNKLAKIIKSELAANNYQYSKEFIYGNFRDGDVRHSLADISKIKKILGYSPEFDISSGLKEAIKWYVTKK